MLLKLITENFIVNSSEEIKDMLRNMSLGSSCVNFQLYSLRFLIYDVINFWRDVWAFVLLKNIYNLFYCDLFYHKRNYNL